MQKATLGMVLGRSLAGGATSDLARVGKGVSQRAEQRPSKTIPVLPEVAKKREFRKPLAKDADKTLMATQPWKAEGLSRRTWYRRLSEQRRKKEQEK